MSRVDVAIVGRDGRGKDNSLRAAWTGKEWRYADASSDPYHVVPARRDTELALSIAFCRRYSWRVCLGYAGCPSISFQTDPYGAAEVFRLRDLPDGASRRKALLNWVSEHWRHNRDESESKVRAHMRGQQRFVWNGLRCDIEPSAFDRQKLEEMRSQPRERRKSARP